MKTALYTRISRDAQAEGLGIERQLEDTRALAKRLGYTVALELSDNDISASTNSRKARPGYDQLVEAVRTGQVGAVLCYSNSRLTRRPRELEDWISLHEQTGVQIATVVSGNDDLSTADGRMTARLKASIDAAEAERTSERLRRQKAQRAASGLPQGGRYRVFGYTRSFEVIEDEALIVKEIFTRRAAGESATAIAKDLASRGLTTAAGKPWTQSSLSKLISRPGYAGMRQHNGAIVGGTCYTPLVSEDLWRAANSEAAKSSPGTNARTHLLSGLARCSKCSAPMVGNSAMGGYRCQQSHGGCGKTRVKLNWLDDPIVSVVMARVLASQNSSQELPPELVDLEAIDREIAAVRASYAAGELALQDMTAVLKDLRSKRAAGEQHNAAATALDQPSWWMEQSSWIRLDVSARRAIIGKHLDSVVVHPRMSTGPGRFEPERYELRWRDGSVQRLTREDLEQLHSWWHSETSTWRTAPDRHVWPELWAAF